MLSTVNDILGMLIRVWMTYFVMLSTADEGVDDKLGMLSTAMNVWIIYLAC